MRFLKSNKDIVDSIEEKVMELEQDEKKMVRQLVNAHRTNPEIAAKNIATYLSESLPIKVEKGFIYELITT